VALMVPEARRASSVAVVFMGWAVAGAVVIPFMSIIADSVNWRTIYAGLAVGAALSAVGVMLLMPKGLYPARMSLKTWGAVLSRWPIILLLATTSVQIAGVFTLYPYLAAELRRVTHADAGGVALVFGLYGGAGLFGSIVAARFVSRLGAPRTQLTCLVALALGLAGWSLFSGSLALAAISVFVWGLGFGAGVSMQQARLIAVAPEAASASVAMNTSVLYLGQALGTAIGAALITHHAPQLMGFVGAGFVVLAIAGSFGVYRRFGA
jgi:MFS transporter, DHA1 family, inner membrane transport protein